MKVFANVDWDLSTPSGNIASWEQVSIAVLMDIRRELRTLNALLACPNFATIPRTLRIISRNTAKRRKT
jgi:hypothetical protein